MSQTQAQIRTAHDLAAQFAERARDKGGSIWLSVKQTAWLKSLALRDQERAGGRERSDVVVYKHHGWPKIEGYGPGFEWTVTIFHNGAGRFELGIR